MDKIKKVHDMDNYNIEGYKTERSDKERSKKIITKSFEYFDSVNKKYENEIKSNKDFYSVDNTVDIGNKKYEYEYLGYFDKKKKIWLWAWGLPITKIGLTTISKDLLFYGVNIDHTDFDYMEDVIFIRTQLVNSRIEIREQYQLDMLLAICSYISKDRFLFITKKEHKLNRNESIDVYYLVKKEI